MAQRTDPGIVTVRPFVEEDLDAAAEFCERARGRDPAIEPFAQRLQLIATGPRALLALWRVAEGEDGALHGIAFAAVREQRSPAQGQAPAAGPAPAPPAGGPSLPGAGVRTAALAGPPRPAYAARPDPGFLAGARAAVPKPELPLPVAPRVPAPFAAAPPLPELPKRGALRKVPVARPPGAPAPPPPAPAQQQRPTSRAAQPPPPPSQPHPGPAAALPAAGEAPASVELYAAVAPALRRQGLGRALCEPAVSWAQATSSVTLRARVRDGAEARAGAAFLAALGFAQRSAQLSLSWRASGPLQTLELPGVQLRALRPGDAKGLTDLARLSDAAWAGAPDSYATRADELAQLLAELERLVLLATLEGKAAGYLSGVWLGKTLGIEEVAVLPEYRRAGLGRRLVEAALARGALAAVLSVAEENKPARGLYRALGFTQTARKLVWELG